MFSNISNARVIHFLIFCFFSTASIFIYANPSSPANFPKKELWESSIDNQQVYSWSNHLTHIKDFLYNQVAVLMHNGSGVYYVYKIIKADPLPGGLVSVRHPWVTGKIPGSSETVWTKNIVYASSLDKHTQSRWEGKSQSEIDQTIVETNGKFLANKVRLSARTGDFPEGYPRWRIRKNTKGEYSLIHSRKMPHGINYIHGEVHYNGVWILFNDARDGFRHISDANFLAELKRFAHIEKREVTILFRDRYMGVTQKMVRKSFPHLEREPSKSTDFKHAKDLLASRFLAYFTTEMRSRHYWFGNPQGPFRRPALWGARTPFPAMNVINGSWKKQLDESLRLEEDLRDEKIVRPPVEPNAYFQKEYKQGTADGAHVLSKLLAYLTYELRVKNKEYNFFFSDKNFLTIAPQEKIIECRNLNEDSGFDPEICGKLASE